METSIRIVDYHLKEHIEGQNSKITSTGETVEKDEFECRVLTRTPFF
jgi:hypothetical protein